MCRSGGAHGLGVSLQGMAKPDAALAHVPVR